MFIIQFMNDDGGWAVAMAMLTPPPTKPRTLPWQHGFSWGGKKRRVRKATYLREWSELWEDRAYDCGCNSWSPRRDAVDSFKKRTHPPLQQYITWTRTTQCPTVQTHTPHCMQETKHTVSRWYRTVYIPWLVASYDTHKGKRWLNFNPPRHRV